MFDRQFFEGKLDQAVQDFASKRCKKGAATGVQLALRDGAVYYVKKVVQAGERLLVLLVYAEKTVSEVVVPYGEIVRLGFVEKAPEAEAAYEAERG